MRKSITTILIVCLALSTLIFGFLWKLERDNKDDVIQLAQAGAVDAYTQFAIYHSDGNESRYWDGVASFRSFQQAYLLIVQGTNKSTNYLFCNEVYGYLIAEPEKSQSHIADIIETMEILAQNVEDENGYAHMADLRNALKR